MTDLEKWKKFLDEMGIKYIEDESEYQEFDDNYPNNEIIKTIDLSIDKSHMDRHIYCPGVYIVFNVDGSFINFLPNGE